MHSHKKTDHVTSRIHRSNHGKRWISFSNSITHVRANALQIAIKLRIKVFTKINDNVFNTRLPIKREMVLIYMNATKNIKTPKIYN